MPIINKLWTPHNILWARDRWLQFFFFFFNWLEQLANVSCKRLMSRAISHLSMMRFVYIKGLFGKRFLVKLFKFCENMYEWKSIKHHYQMRHKLALIGFLYKIDVASIVTYHLINCENSFFFSIACIWCMNMEILSKMRKWYVA